MKNKTGDGVPYTIILNPSTLGDYNIDTFKTLTAQQDGIYVISSTDGIKLKKFLKKGEIFMEKDLQKIREAMQLILDKLIEDELFYDVFMSQLRDRLLKKKGASDE